MWHSKYKMEKEDKYWALAIGHHNSKNKQEDGIHSIEQDINKHGDGDLVIGL